YVAEHAQVAFNPDQVIENVYARIVGRQKMRKSMRPVRILEAIAQHQRAICRRNRFRNDADVAAKLARLLAVLGIRLNKMPEPILACQPAHIADRNKPARRLRIVRKGLLRYRRVIQNTGRRVEALQRLLGIEIASGDRHGAALFGPRFRADLESDRFLYAGALVAVVAVGKSRRRALAAHLPIARPHFDAAADRVVRIVLAGVVRNVGEQRLRQSYRRERDHRTTEAVPRISGIEKYVDALRAAGRRPRHQGEPDSNAPQMCTKRVTRFLHATVIERGGQVVGAEILAFEESWSLILDTHVGPPSPACGARETLECRLVLGHRHMHG